MPVGHHCHCRPFHTLFPSTQLLGASLTASPRRLRRVRVRSLSHITTARTPPGTASRHPNSGNRDPVWLPYAVYCNSCPTNAEQIEVETDYSARVRVLKQKLELLGINCHDFVTPGKYHHLFCPKCNGGQSMVRSLSLHILQDAGLAMWRCFHTECGWAGQAFADIGAACNDITGKVKSFGQMSEESLGLEPLGAKLIAYFGERMISEKTLQRNAVMQMANDKNVIAFTYRQNGLLVGCKYRTIGKKFWQVEGEIDKLSLEEAGLCNCVSVPGGAPGKVSDKEVPSFEKDTGYQYLWNCKENLDKVSRITLATDGDASGQALAEELARRLGKDRCWQVQWPKRPNSSCFKDANELRAEFNPHP
ncbi:hypothetical protein CJ030_MR2G013619 [Morella rubra]|uniref:Toprim domain-containing protein n=1 Tax=Morella rubra TaxID=262757 RepID=A0A6A1WCJ4_9ROSI|nr:hypothetical protein CJ030_MR2G013619 [Morella rubra]